MSAEEICGALEDYAEESGIDLEVLLSIYLVIGEDIFFVFNLLQGQKVKFPYSKSLQKSFSKGIRMLELKANKYKVNGKWKPTSEIEVGDIIEIGSREIAVVLPVRELLGHYYTFLLK